MRPAFRDHLAFKRQARTFSRAAKPPVQFPSNTEAPFIVTETLSTSSKRVAALVPGYAYDEERFFDSDGAPADVVVLPSLSTLQLACASVAGLPPGLPTCCWPLDSNGFIALASCASSADWA